MQTHNGRWFAWLSLPPLTVAIRRMAFAPFVPADPAANPTTTLAQTTPTGAPAQAHAIEKFELRDGDRVVLIGSTLIERDQEYGYLETALTARFYDRNVVFRNLGWSGDTVWGDAWAMFGTSADGYRDRLKNVVGMKPTVIFVGFGTNESFAGQAGLPHFLDGLNTLLDDLAKTGARIVMFSPTREEDLGRPLPDPAEQNRRLALYTDAMRQVAQRRGYRFVDLFHSLIPETKPAGYVPLTDDEMHLTEHGYRRLAEVVDAELCGPVPRVRCGRRPTELEVLRRLINQKNEIAFHRWRPENFTYLYLFRAQEQPGTAAETPNFEPLVAKAEEQIAKMRVPRAPTRSVSEGGAALAFALANASVYGCHSNILRRPSLCLEPGRMMSSNTLSDCGSCEPYLSRLVRPRCFCLLRFDVFR